MSGFFVCIIDFRFSQAQAILSLMDVIESIHQINMDFPLTEQF